LNLKDRLRLAETFGKTDTRNQ